MEVVRGHVIGLSSTSARAGRAAGEAGEAGSLLLRAGECSSLNGRCVVQAESGGSWWGSLMETVAPLKYSRAWSWHPPLGILRTLCSDVA
jgi:hypothetical protein